MKILKNITYGKNVKYWQYQKQVMEQAKFTYSPLGKAFEKQTKTIEDQGEKHVDDLKNSRPEDK